MIIKLDTTAFKRRLWHRAYKRALERINDPQDNRTTETKIQQVVFYGVKCFGQWDDKKQITPEKRMDGINQTIILMGLLTPREFMNIFPPRKNYDGDRWQMKDYFYTVNYLEMIGMDTPLGEKSFEFVMEYWNTDSMRFAVNAMSALSDIYKEKTGIGIMEEFMLKNGIEPYGFY